MEHLRGLASLEHCHTLDEQDQKPLVLLLNQHMEFLGHGYRTEYNSQTSARIDALPIVFPHYIQVLYFLHHVPQVVIEPISVADHQHRPGFEPGGWVLDAHTQVPAQVEPAFYFLDLAVYGLACFLMLAGYGRMQGSFGGSGDEVGLYYDLVHC